MPTVGSLFAGAGLGDIGLTRAGFEHRWMVESDPWRRKVLAKRYPGVQLHGDIKEVSGHELDRVDLIAGGFPLPGHIPGRKRRRPARIEVWSLVRNAQDHSHGTTAIRACGKTHQLSLAEACSTFSEALPRAGTMRSGILSELTPWGLPTSESESGSWRTPQASNASQGPKSRRLFDLSLESGKHEVTLVDQAKWATPTIFGNNNKRGGKRGDGLATQVKAWPTPIKHDFRSPSGAASKRYLRRRAQGWGEELSEAAKGPLNPDWMECLMGVPVGWTDLECEQPEQLPWPAGYVKGGESPQHEWEPPRLTKGKKDRIKRIAAIGDGQVPQVVELIARRLVAILSEEGV